MDDILGRKVNYGDLVLDAGTTPISKESFGIVIGSYKLFRLNNKERQCSDCYLLEPMTPEEQKIKQQLVMMYRKYMVQKEKVKKEKELARKKRSENMDYKPGDLLYRLYSNYRYICIYLGYCQILDGCWDFEGYVYYEVYVREAERLLNYVSENPSFDINSSKQFYNSIIGSNQSGSINTSFFTLATRIKMLKNKSTKFDEIKKCLHEPHIDVTGTFIQGKKQYAIKYLSD